MQGVIGLSRMRGRPTHLQHIHFPELSDNKIQIPLKVDAAQFIMESVFLQGPSGSPFALRNLGWTTKSPIF